MNIETSKMMFALLRSIACGILLFDKDKSLFDERMLP